MGHLRRALADLISPSAGPIHALLWQGPLVNQLGHITLTLAKQIPPPPPPNCPLPHSRRALQELPPPRASPNRRTLPQFTRSPQSSRTAAGTTTVAR
jgi:hypothetical protein